MTDRLLNISACLLFLTLNLSAYADETPRESTQQAEPADQQIADDDTERWLLRYQFEAGTRLRYLSEEKMTLQAQIGESERRDQSQARQIRTYSVQKQRPDGTAQIAMQFEDVWMQKKIDDLPPIEFRSSMPESEVPQVFKAVAHSLAGAASVCNVSPTGQALAAGNDGDRTADESSDAVDSFLMPLPAHRVAIGESWKEEITLPVRGGKDLTLQVVVLRTYRLDQVEQDIATISFRSSVRTQLRSPTIRSQLIQATPAGEFQLNLKTGQMLSRKFRHSATVIGALGAESLLSSVGVKTESLLKAEAPALTN